jgi:hypothetical protein
LRPTQRPTQRGLETVPGEVLLGGDDMILNRCMPKAWQNCTHWQSEMNFRGWSKSVKGWRESVVGWRNMNDMGRSKSVIGWSKSIVGWSNSVVGGSKMNVVG